MYHALCTLLASVLLLGPVMQARAAAESGLRPQEGSAQKPTLKEKLVSMPPQSYVEVRLLDKSKLRGRLGQITDEGFAVQVAQGNKIQNVNVSFDQVKSVKVVETKASKTGRGLLYALAGIGALFVVLIIWVASRED
jgi:hypothetical protein